jgi:hypothetical protein
VEDPFPKAGVIIAEVSNSTKARRRCRLMEYAIAPGTCAAARLRKPIDDMLKSPNSKPAEQAGNCWCNSRVGREAQAKVLAQGIRAFAFGGREGIAAPL